MATNIDTFRLKLAPEHDYDFNVDWGDGKGLDEYTFTTAGSSEEESFVDHVYDSPGIYDVKIYERSTKGFPQLYFNGLSNSSSTTDDIKLTNIIEWGYHTWGDLSGSFAGCSNLSSINTERAFSDLNLVKKFNSAWAGCSGLKTFPYLNVTSGTDFTSAWSNCFSLTSFPVLSTQSATDFSFAWQNCVSLSGFPLLSAHKVNNFDGTWFGCSALKSFPANFNTSSGTSFASAWANCVSLAGAFPTIVTLSAQNLSYAWYNCSLITGVFPNINIKNATNLNSTWYKHKLFLTYFEYTKCNKF